MELYDLLTNIEKSLYIVPVYYCRPGGILVGQINNSAFYERKQDSEYKQHALPLEGKPDTVPLEDLLKPLQKGSGRLNKNNQFIRQAICLNVLCIKPLF